MTTEITTTKGTWKIHGINFTSSDSIFGMLKKAIENGNLRQRYLQLLTGFSGTIYIDRASKEIHFFSVPTKKSIS